MTNSYLYRSLSVRLTPELFGQVAAEASDNGQSLTATVVRLLTLGLRRIGGGVDSESRVAPVPVRVTFNTCPKHHLVSGDDGMLVCEHCGGRKAPDTGEWVAGD